MRWQHVIVLLDRLLRSKVIDASSIIQLVFDDDCQDERQVYQYLSSSWLSIFRRNISIFIRFLWDSFISDPVLSHLNRGCNRVDVCRSFQWRILMRVATYVVAEARSFSSSVRQIKDESCSEPMDSTSADDAQRIMKDVFLMIMQRFVMSSSSLLENDSPSSIDAAQQVLARLRQFSRTVSWSCCCCTTWPQRCFCFQH